MVVAVANQTNQANQIEAKDFKAIFAAEIGDGKKHTIAIDAEWDSRFKPSLILGYALVVESKYKFVVLNEAIRDNSIKDKKGKKLEVPKEIVERIEKHCQAKDYILRWMPLNDDSCDATSAILREYGIHKASFDVLMYYSPMDLNISFGFKNLDPYYKKGDIKQKKRLSGDYRNDDLKYRVCDLKGWSNTSLKGFAASVGVEMTAKDEMDDYKTHMLDGLIAEPETFLDYMVGDTTCLFEIREKFVENIQWLQGDVIKLPELAVDTIDTIPFTIGSIVAGTLEKYIRYCLCPDRHLELVYALLKLGIIDPDAKDKKEVTALHHELRLKITDSKTFIDNRDEVIDLIQKNIKNKTKHKYQFEAFSQCSVNYFGRETKTSEAFLALVQGGRCNNEQYWRYWLDYAADIDLKSAYASVLRRIDYPIGLPNITSFTPNEKRWTLEKWFKETKVLDGSNHNWMVIVNGDLSFSQDLLYSKDTKQKKINKAVISATEDALGTHDHNDDAHIEGLFVLARKELQNAVITADIWETIEKVATTTELKELRNIEIVAGAYYSDKDKCTDINEWIDKVLANNAEYVTDKKTGCKLDNRTRAWFSLPLEDVFGKIIDTRNQLKSEAKEANAEGNHEKYLRLNGRQEALKLFNNTGYGVLASPYFNIGNTVVANNITAQIRLAVWQMSKALNTCQSITDGGMYEPSQVSGLKTEVNSFRKPSLTRLSDLQELQECRNVEVVSLGDIDWKSLITELFREDLTDEEKKRLQKELAEKSDKFALKHIKEFWQAYGLNFQFDVEHKAENFAERLAYWSKGDYGFIRAIKNEKTGEKAFYKIRGAKRNKDKDKKNHPKYELFDNILGINDTFPKDLEYIFQCLLKVGKFKVIQDSKNGYQDYKDLQPGDNYEEPRIARFNNTHMPVDTIKEYRKRYKRSKKENRILFEKHGSQGIKWVIATMMMDKLYGRNS